MQYRLRTLLILLAAGPPILAGAWFAWQVEWSTEVYALIAVGGFAASWVATIVMLQE